MERRTRDILLALIRSAISGEALPKELAAPTGEQLTEALRISAAHDVDHLVAQGIRQNGLLPEASSALDKCILKAVYRHQQLKYDSEKLLLTLEAAKIPHLPLKGAVLRGYYPKPWMRTSCDTDVLVHKEELDKAINCLVGELSYKEKERATHDVSFTTRTGNTVELHFDLVEEGRANAASEILGSVWSDAKLCSDSEYRYGMSDAFFYFYHIAHMAKHFECGGCGIRPFIDLWILDSQSEKDVALRDELLQRGGLLKFAKAARRLAAVWFAGETDDGLTERMSEFLLHGGAYGSSDNRVALQQRRRGGKIGYIFSRIFIPYSKLKLYYPVLERHPYLMPFMQIRRWFMLFRSDVARMARSELAANSSVGKSDAERMSSFMNDLGL